MPRCDCCNTVSGIQSRRFALVIKQLGEAVGKQANDVLGGINIQRSLSVCYRQPELDVVGVGVRRLAESRHGHQTFGTVRQPVIRTQKKTAKIIRRSLAKL